MERKSEIKTQLKPAAHRLAVLLVALILTTLLAACGNPSPTAGPAATLSPFNSPITAVPTPGTTAEATDIPDLAYKAGREIKVSDDLIKGVLGNVGQNANLVGNFSGVKINFYATSDTNDKVEEYYRKLMISTGWGAFNRQGDDNGTILVYQKAGTKLVINVNTVTTLDNFPADFKNSLKVGEHLVFTAIGKAIQPPATTVVIPGTPTAEVKAGQKKVFTIELDKGGIITGELYPDLAPISVENFEKLANRGFYAGLTFHRVEPGFVVQGGDPKGDGTGGPGYNITGEFATNTALYKVPAGLEAKAKHVYGSLAWARSQDLNSAGSQFYIVIGQEADANVSSLNGKYAVFGKVTDGMDLVIKIAKGDKIKSVKVEVK